MSLWTCHSWATLSTQKLVPEINSQMGTQHRPQLTSGRAAFRATRGRAGRKCATAPAKAALPLMPANGCENASAAARPAATALLATLLRVPPRVLVACCAAWLLSRPPLPC